MKLTKLSPMSILLLDLSSYIEYLATLPNVSLKCLIFYSEIFLFAYQPKSVSKKVLINLKLPTFFINLQKLDILLNKVLRFHDNLIELSFLYAMYMSLNPSSIVLFDKLLWPDFLI